ncbi:MAG TPA: metallophosphoesterase, partial [Ktedonobacteraceae bacterium]|nr:metallophosphoesterase [Ktedonobacteraceae bacterium]
MQNTMHVQKTRLLRFRHLFSLSTVLFIVLASVSILFTLAQYSTRTHAASSGSFTFTAAGDYSNSSETTANLQLIANSGAQFNLALGDLNYDPNLSAGQWSSYVKSNLPPNFPFEIIAGNEDTANMARFEADLPNHLGNISGTYGQEYYFDYPAGAPLARVIMISPAGILPGYNFSAGGSDYNWLSQQIDGARSAGIPWVIVGMHEFCLAMGPIPCTIGADLENLLLSKKVDLVLQAHIHSYQVSKQLALNSTNCQSMTIGSYNAGCVANASSKLTKGVGSVFVITATG